jgi:hypothetical protein
MPIPDASLRVLAAWADAFETGLPTGEWRGGEADAAGVIQMPWFEASDEIDRFTREMAGAGLVQSVPWMDWAQTEEAQRFIRDPGEIAHATRDDLVYLLTAIIRGERFSDGQIAGAYERGTLLALARRAQVLLESRAAGEAG